MDEIAMNAPVSIGERMRIDESECQCCGGYDRIQAGSRDPPAVKNGYSERFL